MEKNPAYGSALNYTVSQAPTADNTYELVDLPATNEACADKKNTAAGDHEIPKVDKGRSIIGVIVAAIVAVLALVVAIAAITATVVLSQTDNSNQEIQTLQLEIENLREMLNQTTMMVEELGNQLSTLQTNTRTQNGKCIHECRKCIS